MRHFPCVGIDVHEGYLKGMTSCNTMMFDAWKSMNSWCSVALNAIYIAMDDLCHTHAI